MHHATTYRYRLHGIDAHSSRNPCLHINKSASYIGNEWHSSLEVIPLCLALLNLCLKVKVFYLSQAVEYGFRLPTSVVLFQLVLSYLLTESAVLLLCQYAGCGLGDFCHWFACGLVVVYQSASAGTLPLMR